MTREVFRFYNFRRPFFPLHPTAGDDLLEQLRIHKDHDVSEQLEQGSRQKRIPECPDEGTDETRLREFLRRGRVAAGSLLQGLRWLLVLLRDHLRDGLHHLRLLNPARPTQHKWQTRPTNNTQQVTGGNDGRR